MLMAARICQPVLYSVLESPVLSEYINSITVHSDFVPTTTPGYIAFKGPNQLKTL